MGQLIINQPFCEHEKKLIYKLGASIYEAKHTQ